MTSQPALSYDMMSSPISYYTAQEIPSPSGSHNKMDESNEGDSIKSPYHGAKPIPFELREHCVIYFEEQLCIGPPFIAKRHRELTRAIPDNQAIALLTHLTTSIATYDDCSKGASQPVFVPPPQHLALVATLVVHPSLTSQHSSSERLQASNAALRLLRAVNRIVGPLNASFASAFVFDAPSRDRRGGHDKRKLDRDDLREDDDQMIDHINSHIANAGSLWACGEDLWHVVGWAFNCSIVYPKRWTRWKLWLEFMVEVLEDDWQERERMITEQTMKEPAVPDEVVEDLLADSLIVEYLPNVLRGYGGQKRVMRAIFADGSTRSQGEFKEVFKDETKEWKEDGEGIKRKRETRVNVSEELYGDYLDDDDNDDEEGDAHDRTGLKTRAATRGKGPEETKGNGIATEKITEDMSAGSQALGGIEAFSLRQRLLSLVSIHPSTFLLYPDNHLTLQASYPAILRLQLHSRALHHHQLTVRLLSRFPASSSLDNIRSLLLLFINVLHHLHRLCPLISNSACTPFTHLLFRSPTTHHHP